MDGPRGGGTGHDMPGMPNMPGMGHSMPESTRVLPEVRNVTHLHGAAVQSTDPLNRLYNNDGWSDAWNVPGQQQIADYPNVQNARALWYHDHAMGVTGRNVASGLVGMYIIRDAYEKSLNLPYGRFEIPLILQAINIDAAGVLHYTPEIWREFYGNAVAVNGRVRPYLEVEPRKYRFRILNASNARMYGLKLLDYNDGSAGPGFYQIGTDAGLLENTALINDPNDPESAPLYLASAERADVIIDFSKYAGKELMLRNLKALTDPDAMLPVPQLMLFKVKAKVSVKDTSSLPMQMRRVWSLSPKNASRHRQILLSQMDHPDGSSMFMLDNRSWFYKKKDECGDYWDYQIDVKPVLGSTEVWELTNTTTMIHPFHIHLVDFQILDRRPFDVEQFNQTGKVVFTGPAELPLENEGGYKDVVRAMPGHVTRIIMRFGPYPGYFMYHCHILEHEDMDMMVPFQVVEPK
jgi:spore coat protein A